MSPQAKPTVNPGRLDFANATERVRKPADWLCEPLLERGRLVHLHAPAGAGKSLIALDICAALATGRSILGNPARKPIRVLYLDHENNEGDIFDRLEDLGYSDAWDLLAANMWYETFPDMPPLDTESGGIELKARVSAFGANLVVIDTLSRVVQGKENASDTYDDMYRLSLKALKRDGVTVLRLDHTGKNEDLGARGSSAKMSDVDDAWQMSLKAKETLEFKRVKSRHGKGVEQFKVRRSRNPSGQHLVGSVEVDRVPQTEREKLEAVVQAMVLLELGPEMSVVDVTASLRDAGVPTYSKSVMVKAVSRFRSSEPVKEPKAVLWPEVRKPGLGKPAGQ